jgi:hypothetical protein
MLVVARFDTRVSSCGSRSDFEGIETAALMPGGTGGREGYSMFMMLGIVVVVGVVFFGWFRRK